MNGDAARETGEATAGMRVLVVDDDPDLCDMMAFAFELEGFETQKASCGREAFELIRRGPVDIVVSDVRMPDGDGIQLLGDIKTVNPQLPLVILTTGFADLCLEEAYDHGAEALFVKPFILHELIGCVKNLLRHTDRRYTARRDIRVTCRLPIEVVTSGSGASYRGSALNLSKGGMFVELEGTYPDGGSDVSVRIVTDGRGRSLPLVGIVAWLRHDLGGATTGCGVVFQETSGPARAEYFEILNSVKTTQLKA